MQIAWNPQQNFCDERAELFTVQAGGTYSNHCALIRGLIHHYSGMKVWVLSACVTLVNYSLSYQMLGCVETDILWAQ